MTNEALGERLREAAESDRKAAQANVAFTSVAKAWVKSAELLEEAAARVEELEQENADLRAWREGQKGVNEYYREHEARRQLDARVHELEMQLQEVLSAPHLCHPIDTTDSSGGGICEHCGRTLIEQPGYQDALSKAEARAEQAEAQLAACREERDKKARECELRKAHLDSVPLCPDCRDKVRGQPCLRCQIQTLVRQLAGAREALAQIAAAPHLPHNDWVRLLAGSAKAALASPGGEPAKETP